MPFHVLTVVGTRPNFIKVTQLERVFAQYGDMFSYKLLHTGQHYDENMSKVFFDQLKLREPDYYLHISGGSPASQMGKIMGALSDVLTEWRVDLIIVVGDVNSTFAAALTANKHGVPIAHLESGLRSRDRDMPEEINRLLTDEITDHFFITESSGLENLQAEGKSPDQLHMVGNTMIDTLVAFEKDIQASPVLDELGVSSGEYALMTMHRPSNVDTEAQLRKVVDIIQYICKKRTLVFPIHPRTRHRMESFGFWDQVQATPNLVIAPPLDYLAFQKLIAHCRYILTDSGGIQEETTFRQVSCITLRENTERPSTVTLGTNVLASLDVTEIEQHISAIEAGTFKPGSQIPPLWDGKATERIVEVIRTHLVAQNS